MIERTSTQEQPMHFKHYNVIAAFANADAARHALESLSKAGVSAEHLSLLASLPEDEDPAIDKREASVIAKSAIKGSAAGAATGSVLGLLAGAAAVAIPGFGLAIGAGLWLAAGAINGAILGSVIGGIYGGEAALSMGDAWERAYNLVQEGQVLVGVHLDDDKQFAHAVQVLEDAEPQRVFRFDSQGGGLPKAA